MVSRGITDDAVVQEAARQEIIRRYFRYQCEFLMGFCEQPAVERAELLMKEMNLKPEDRSVVVPARRPLLKPGSRTKARMGFMSEQLSS